jgi:hypothetical protein
MQRSLEVSAPLTAGLELVVEILSRDPARVLTGTSAAGNEVFAAEIAVELGGGTSLAHEVDMVFDHRPDDGAVGHFGLSWRARDHQGAFPVFGGDLEVQPDGDGSRLRLCGHYSLPLGAVGAFGDRLLGHRLARRSVQGFLDAAAARIDAEVADATVSVGEPHPELYLG